MFADTVTLVVNAVSKVLTKINPDSAGSLYSLRSATELYRLRIRHTKTKATVSKPAYERHNVEFVRTTFAVGAVPEYDQKVYIVYEHLASDSNIHVPDALAEWLRNASNANLVKLVNGEA